MVAERIELFDEEGKTIEAEVSLRIVRTDSTTSGFDFLPIGPSEDEEDRVFTAAGWAAFAEDWESPDDSVFDDLLEDDAKLRKG